MLKSLTRIAIVLSFATTAFAGYDEDFKAANSLGASGKRAEALAAFIKLADTSKDEQQICDSLKQAAINAAVLGHFDQAMELARRIPVATLSKSCQMVVLSESRKYKELMEQFKDEDLAAWPKSVSGDAFRMRGESAWFLRDGKQAVADLTRAADLLEDGYYRDRAILTLGNVYEDLLKDENKAIEAYVRVSNGMPAMKYNAYWLTADIYLRQNQPAKALEILDQIDISKTWGDAPLNVLRSKGQALSELKRPAEAIAAYQAALKLEGVSPAIRKALESAIEPLILASPDLVVLAAKGKSDYQIVIPDSSPTPEIEKRMAEIAQLVQNAFEANGFEIAIVSEAKRDPTRPGLFLGDTAFARSNGVNVATFPDWRYVHKVVGRDVIVAGREQPCPIAQDPKRPRMAWSGLDRLGTLKAATDFLRQYAGVRFLLPGGETGIEFLPTPMITVPTNLDVLKIPPFQFKFNFAWGESVYEIANNCFPAVDMDGVSHTWPRAIPESMYGETHPEYFALSNGKRYTKSQYCISNPEVQELIYKDMLAMIGRGLKTVLLSQPDGFMPCQCEPCKKLFGTEDWGDKIWILHRNLAERLLKEQPDIKVMIIAYGQTYSPPKSFKDFPPNAIVYLCHTDPDTMKEWSACNVPGGYAAYTYTFLGGYLPGVTPLGISKMVKRFSDFKIKGIMLDGFNGNYGLNGPVFYVYGRTMDEPANLQAKDLLMEFYEGAYLEAATPMRRFFDTFYSALQFSYDAKWTFEDVYGRSCQHAESEPMRRVTMIYSPALLKDLETHLGQAERLATSEKVKRRIALVRLEFDYARHIATVGHLWNAFSVDPDLAARERLLKAVDAWNTFLKRMYDDGKGGWMRSGMRKDVIPGWPEMWPFYGHSRYLVAMTENNWAGNWKDMPLNWNTAELRKTSLAAAQRLAVKSADGAITLDAPAWSTVAAAAFSTLPGESTPLTRKTSVRMLYDKTQLCLLIESDLPGTLKDFAPVVKDGQPTQAESLDIAIAPAGESEKYYRFIIGPQSQPRYQAAHGFISDTVHPLYGKDDPGWQGSWTYETRLEPEKNRWLALLTIPYKTMGVEPPAVGTLWRGNVIRLHAPAQNQLERSAWSATTQNKGGQDPNSFGELVFDDASGSAGAGKAEK